MDVDDINIEAMKMAATSPMTFQIYFAGWQVLYFDWNSDKICSWWSNGECGSILCTNALSEPMMTSLTDKYMYTKPNNEYDFWGEQHIKINDDVFM